MISGEVQILGGAFGKRRGHLKAGMFNAENPQLLIHTGFFQRLTIDLLRDVETVTPQYTETSSSSFSPRRIDTEIRFEMRLKDGRQFLAKCLADDFDSITGAMATSKYISSDTTMDGTAPSNTPAYNPPAAPRTIGFHLKRIFLFVLLLMIFNLAATMIVQSIGIQKETNVLGVIVLILIPVSWITATKFLSRYTG